MSSDIVERLIDAQVTVAARACDALDADVYDALGDAVKEIERLREKCTKQAMILRRLTPENFPDTYFICGEAGEKDQNGLPAKIMVVPAYGVDWSMVYERTDKSFGPEW